MKTVLVLPLAITLAAACGKSETGAPKTPAASAAPEKSADAPEATEPAEAEPTAEADAAPEKKKDLTGCEAHFEKFDKLLGEATYACKKDTDCGCFEVGVSRTPGSQCGGVVEKKLATKLDVVAKAARKDSCATSAMCDAWTCAPVCEDGRCRKSPSKK